MNRFHQIKEVLKKGCQLALGQPMPDKQLILLTYACSQEAKYAVSKECDPNQKPMSKRKTYALIAYGSKAFTPSQIKTSNQVKES